MENDYDNVKAIGHGIMALVNAAILVAILAVVLAPGSQTAAMIQGAFGLLSWLVGLVIQPLTAGSTVTLSNKLQPAGAYQVTQGGTGGTSTTAGQAQAAPGGTGSQPAGQQPLIRLCDQSGNWQGYAQPGTDPSMFPSGLHACG